MSSTYYKLRYTDHFGSYGSSRERYLYVHEHNTSDTTTVYNEEGEVVYSYHADNEEEAKALCRIITGECSDREHWSGEVRDKKAE